MKAASRLQYGCTWINTHFMLTNEMPHGGLKQSGYGKDMSVYALEGLHRRPPHHDQPRLMALAPGAASGAISIAQNPTRWKTFSSHIILLGAKES